MQLFRLNNFIVVFLFVIHVFSIHFTVEIISYFLYFLIIIQFFTLYLFFGYVSCFKYCLWLFFLNFLNHFLFAINFLFFIFFLLFFAFTFSNYLNFLIIIDIIPLSNIKILIFFNLLINIRSFRNSPSSNILLLTNKILKHLISALLPRYCSYNFRLKCKCFNNFLANLLKN